MAQIGLLTEAAGIRTRFIDLYDASDGSYQSSISGIQSNVHKIAFGGPSNRWHLLNTSQVISSIVTPSPLATAGVQLHNGFIRPVDFHIRGNRMVITDGGTFQVGNFTNNASVEFLGGGSMRSLPNMPVSFPGIFGIALYTDDTILFGLNNPEYMVMAYNIGTDYQFTENQSLRVRLAAANAHPAGMTIAGTNLHVGDSTDKQTYVYPLA